MLLPSSMLIISSIILTISSHPVTLLCCIMIQTFIICCQAWFMMKISWLSFILFLIFLGGLMVIFVYIVSLAANEKFEIDYNSTINMVMVTSIFSMILFLMIFFYLKNSPLSNNLFCSNIIIFSEMMMIPTALIMFYLLFTLIVAIKISSKTEGPLRNFIK